MRERWRDRDEERQVERERERNVVTPTLLLSFVLLLLCTLATKT